MFRCFTFTIATLLVTLNRKNHQHAIESIESSLEAEQRGKADAVRAKKKLEGEINELEAALDSANRGRMEAEKNVKKHQAAINELRQQIEDEHRAREEADKQVNTSSIPGKNSTIHSLQVSHLSSVVSRK